VALESFPGLVDWNLNSERLYFSSIVSLADSDPITVILENENGNMLGDSAKFFFDYTITLPFVSDQYKGSTEFTIYLDSRNQWFITKWKDFKKGDFPSWSELKGTYN
jgi:hypothetical protein